MPRATKLAARLQRRMHVDRPTPELVRGTPIWFIIFDLLHLGSRSTLDLPPSVGRGRRFSTRLVTAGEKPGSYLPGTPAKAAPCWKRPGTTNSKASSPSC